MSEPTAPAAKVGWVKKQGRSGIYKNWKKRYFVLKKGCISYYEEADKPETLKGDLHLAETEVKDEIKKKSDKQIYIASFNGDANLLMEFDSQAEVEQWLISIKEHIAYANELSTNQIKASDLRMSLSRFSVPTLKKGWLIKQGRGKVKSWKRRFFVLNNGTISYYEKDAPTFPFGDVLKGDLFLTNSKVIVENQQKPNMIFIECSHDEKSLLVEVEASDDVSSWVNSINSHIIFANQSSADNNNVKKSVIKEYSRYTICATTLEEEGSNNNNMESSSVMSSPTSKQKQLVTEDKSCLDSTSSTSSVKNSTSTTHATATAVTISSTSNKKISNNLDDDMLMDEEEVVTANKPFLDTSRSIKKKSERNNDQEDVLSKALFAIGGVLIALQFLLGLVFKKNNVTSSFLLVGVLMIGSGFYLLNTKSSSPSTQQQQQSSSSSLSSTSQTTGSTASKTISSTTTAAAADTTSTLRDNTTSTAAVDIRATFSAQAATTTHQYHQQHLAFEDDESDNDNDSDDSNFDGSTLPTIRQSVSVREDLLADINLSQHQKEEEEGQYPRLDDDIRGVDEHRDSDDHYDPNKIQTLRTNFSS